MYRDRARSDVSGPAPSGTRISRVSVPRLFVPDAAGAAVRLSIDEAHHVAHVLRLEGGDPVIVFDGRGAEWDGLIMQVGKRGVTVQDAAAATACQTLTRLKAGQAYRICGGAWQKKGSSAIALPAYCASGG